MKQVGALAVSSIVHSILFPFLPLLDIPSHPSHGIVRNSLLTFLFRGDNNYFNER
jgi:hypothetical protein